MSDPNLPTSTSRCSEYRRPVDDAQPGAIRTGKDRPRPASIAHSARGRSSPQGCNENRRHGRDKTDGRATESLNCPPPRAGRVDSRGSPIWDHTSKRRGAAPVPVGGPLSLRLSCGTPERSVRRKRVEPSQVATVQVDGLGLGARPTAIVRRTAHLQPEDRAEQGHDDQANQEETTAPSAGMPTTRCHFGLSRGHPEPPFLEGPAALLAAPGPALASKAWEPTERLFLRADRSG